MKQIITLFLLSIASITLAQNSKQDMNWLTFEQLSDSLELRPKKTLLFFHADWCAYCRKMEKSVFTDPSIIRSLKEYYVVRFDAESTEPIYFDNHIYTNPSPTKRRGSFHSLASLLAARKGQITLPTIIVLNEKFEVESRTFTYLSVSQLKKIVTKL